MITSLNIIATDHESVRVTNRGCAGGNEECTVSLDSRPCMLQRRPETRHRNLFRFSFMTKLSQKLHDTLSETTARSP
jgi:hypothetical protein